jgi:hypothetical protein
MDGYERSRSREGRKEMRCGNEEGTIGEMGEYVGETQVVNEGIM